MKDVKKHDGLFVVFEGIDGSGKGTQVQLLEDALRVAGHKVHKTAEPSTWPMGMLLRRYLRGEEPVTIDWSSMALLFAADRLQHVQYEILPRLQEGYIVLCDRYVASSMAYQSAMHCMDRSKTTDSEVLSWIATVNSRALPADITLFLDVSIETASARRQARGAPNELLEREALLACVREQYEIIGQKHMNDHFVIVSGERSPAEIHQDILYRVL